MSLIKRNRNDAPARFTPAGPLGDFDSLFDRFFSTPFAMRPWPVQETEMTRTFAPALEVFRNNGEMVVRADLPGMKKDEVELKIQDDTLTLSGHRRHEDEGEREGYHYSERSYGEFSRSLRLPSDVDPGKAKAGFKDGVLEIRLPIAEEAKPRKIEISTN